MAHWNTRGLRGSAFEEEIEYTNRLYRGHALAVVQKIPTPITPIEVDNRAHTISKAYFEKKSTVDFIGAAQGVPIAFDAKETRYKHLPIRNIHPHQIEFMEEFRNQGGVCFLLVRFYFTNEVFFLPCEELAKHYGRSLRGGRKSIAYAEFEKNYLVHSKGGYPIHYLEAVNTYITK